MKRRYSSSTWTRVRAAGFTMIELMVALALSLLLLLGVVAIFSSSRVAYESTDQLSRVQETGRFALDEISRRVRAAGFSSCSRQPNFDSSALQNRLVLQWAFDRSPVEGMDGATPLDSDVVVVRGVRMDFQPVSVTADMANTQAPLTVSSTAGIRENDVVVAYSCEGRSFFQVTGVGATSLAHAFYRSTTQEIAGNAFATTNYPFRRDAEVAPVDTTVYFVAESPPAGPFTTLPPPTPRAGAATSLYRRIGFGIVEELVSGVERMQAEYGLDTDGDSIVDRYVHAREVARWDRVLAVRVTMLVRSVDQYGQETDQREYKLPDGITVTAPGDRRLREIFTVTASIRNRTRTD